MRPKTLALVLVIGAAALVLSRGPWVRAQGINLDTTAIEEATGLKGQLIPEERVFKVSKPRTDVKVQVDQWNMPPSWVSGPGRPSRRTTWHRRR